MVILKFKLMDNSSTLLELTNENGEGIYKTNDPMQVFIFQLLCQHKHLYCVNCMDHTILNIKLVIKIIFITTIVVIFRS